MEAEPGGMEAALSSAELCVPEVSAWVASVRRSGRTWMRWLIGNAVLLNAGMVGGVDWHNFHSVVPNDDSRTPANRYTRNARAEGASTPPLIVMTHRSFEQFPDVEAPIVVLLRACDELI